MILDPSSSILNPRPILLLFSMLIIGCSENQPPAAAPPPGPSPALVSARRALDAGQGDDAVAEAGSYLQREPNGTEAAEAHYMQGRGYEEKHYSDAGELRRNLYAAHSAYLQALQKNPSRDLEANIHASLSNVAFLENDFATTIEQATTASTMIASPETKSFLLYRIGLSQQRLSRFTDADMTFNQVIQRYPDTRIAENAREHFGQRSFYVQLATYPTAEAADKDNDRIKSAGIVSRRTNVKGITIIDDGPFPTFQDAQKAKDALAGQFPDSVIVP